MTLHNERKLINQLTQGSEKAFKIIFDRYYTLLCAIACHYVNDRSESILIAEDALLSLWEKRDELQDLRSLKAYLLITTRNRSIDYLRTSHTETWVGIDDINPNCFTSDDVLFEQYLATELELHIHQAINQLPLETRQVFLLSRNDGLSYTEIADRLHISVNTVKYHMKQALAMLRKSLREYLALWLIFFLSSLQK